MDSAAVTGMTSVLSPGYFLVRQALKSLLKASKSLTGFVQRGTYKANATTAGALVLCTVPVCLPCENPIQTHSHCYPVHKYSALLSLLQATRTPCLCGALDNHAQGGSSVLHISVATYCPCVVNL